MEEDAEKTTRHIWVDWKNRVISFHKAEGFAHLVFPTHEQMFAFAVEKGFEGFAIQ